jgi:hypothetical protein
MAKNQTESLENLVATMKICRRSHCLIYLMLFFSTLSFGDECGKDGLQVDPRVEFIRQQLGSSTADCVQKTELVFDESLTLSWVEVPDSSQDSVYQSQLDDALGERYGAPNSWSRIQSAWGGATVARGRLYVWGGGHADGANNALLSVDPMTGEWTRVLEPSPLWEDAQCPGAQCPARTGACRFNSCNAGPDGRPVSRHTYNNLAADDRFIYSSGGSVWRSGKKGDGPRNWKYDLDSKEWSTFPESGNEKVGLNLVHVDGKLYQLSPRGHAVYSVSEQTWEVPSKLNGFKPKTRMVFDKSTDRFYLIGDGVAKWTQRRNFGLQWQDIALENPQAVSQVSPGVTVYNGRVLIWAGGNLITTLHTHTNEWGSISLSGDPGPALARGTFGRFAAIADQVVLINGANKNMYKVMPLKDGPLEKLVSGSRISSDVKAGVTQGAAPTPIPVPVRRRAHPVAAPSSIPTNPYFSGPQGVQLVEDICGPISDWPVLDLRTDADAESLRSLKSGQRLLVRVHWKEQGYLSLRAKKAKCLKFLGIAGPNGEKPLVMNVNGTTSSRSGLRAGGLIIENLRVSPGDIKLLRGEGTSGDCIGIPNDQQFVIMRGIDVSGCPHHAFITSNASQMYLEIDDSNFEQSSSHLAYIDRVAYAYVHDSTFQSPGWGHALRCIAATCHIENVSVSNVQLDHSVLPPGGTTAYNDDRRYVGMHPLEVYTCGGGHKVKNVKVSFLGDNRNGSFAAAFRWREAMNTCDLAGHDEIQWNVLRYGSDEWNDAKTWETITDIDLTVDNMQVSCVGDPCYAWSVASSYPLMNDSQKLALSSWLKKNAFSSWSEMVGSMPDSSWIWLANNVHDRYKRRFLTGNLVNKIPLPVPPFWHERASLKIQGLQVNNGNPNPIRPGKKAEEFCWGSFADNGNCTLDYRRAAIEIH